MLVRSKFCLSSTARRRGRRTGNLTSIAKSSLTREGFSDGFRRHLDVLAKEFEIRAFVFDTSYKHVNHRQMYKFLLANSTADRTLNLC